MANIDAENINFHPFLKSGEDAQLFKSILNDFKDNSLTTQYMRFKEHNHTDPYISGYTYFFMTKPPLYIFNESPNKGRNSFLSFMFEFFQQELENCFAVDKGVSNGFFIKLFSNRFQEVSMSDVDLSTMTYGETYAGYKMTLGKGISDSTSGGTFNVTYDELKIPLITYLTKVWVDYIRNSRKGTYEVEESTITNAKLDYTSSVYVFSTEPDGETLRNWSRYVGVFPVVIPVATFFAAPTTKELVKPSITYAYSFKEDLDLDVLKAFNDTGLLENEPSVFKTYEQKATDLYKQVFSKTLDKPAPLNQIERFQAYGKQNLFNDCKVIKENNTYKLVFTNENKEL